MTSHSRPRVSPRVLGAAGLTVLGTACWLGLGMNRGLLLSSDIKSRCWPWAPTYAPAELQAPVLSDPVWQFVPWLEFARRELRAARLPLWNPHQNGGVPLLGNAQSALGSPLNLPVLLLGVENGWNLGMLLRIVVAAAGAFLWLRDCGRSRAAASLGAVMFGLSGPFVAWLEHPHTLTAAPVPFVLLFCRRMARRGSTADLLGLVAATAAVLLGGHPETVITAALVVIGIVLLDVGRFRDAAQVLPGAVIALLLAAPVVLPFAEYFLGSAARYGVLRQPFTLPLSSLVRFVLPHSQSGHPVEAAATVSVVGLVLALAGAMTPGAGRLRSLSIGTAAVLLLLAYDNPLARLAVGHTPMYWSRGLLLLPLCLGVLAATALDGLRSVVTRRLGERTATLCAAGIAALALGELLAAARGVHAVTPPGDVRRTTPLLQRLAAEREPFRILPLHTFLPPESATAFGLDDVRGYDALAPRDWLREREAMGRFTAASFVTDVLEPWNLAPGGRALDLWNVKYLLIHPQLPYTAERLKREFGLDLEEVYLGPDGRLLRNRHVLPRARLSGEGTVIVRGRSATRWRLEVNAAADTSLFLADPMFPGWRARVDGKREAIRSRTGTAIEVPVAAGRHDVEISYEPASFRLGLAGAAVSLILLVVMVWRGRRVRPESWGGSPPGSPSG